MYDHATKDKFVELRAAGKSFGDIAEQLGTAKSTLHDWADERADDIARLRRRLWEEAEAEFGTRIEDQLTDLVCYMKDCEFRIKEFNLGTYSLRDAFTILRQSRREYFRLRALLMGTDRTPRKSNKTERSHETAPTEHRNTNDLQQSKPQSFDFQAPSGGPTQDPGLSTQDSHSTASAPPGRSDENGPAESTSGEERLPYNPELGSIAYNPLECGAAILQKCLDAEAAYAMTHQLGAQAEPSAASP